MKKRSGCESTGQNKYPNVTKVVEATGTFYEDRRVSMRISNEPSKCWYILTKNRSMRYRNLVFTVRIIS